MSRKFQISQEYPVNIQTLWNDILDFQALSDSMEGALSYEGLPTEPVSEGERIVVWLKRWGWLPMGTWTIDIIQRDDENYILESREFGNVIRCHHHVLKVVALDDQRCRYTDYLDVDAGVFTPMVLPTIRKMYEERHKARLKRLTPLDW